LVASVLVVSGAEMIRSDFFEMWTAACADETCKAVGWEGKIDTEAYVFRQAYDLLDFGQTLMTGQRDSF
jgi:hypothetical protein